MKELYLFRHGETEWSKSGQHTGLTDIPLIDEGITQAKALKKIVKGLTFNKVYCSPLTRVKSTCEYCGLLDKAIINSDLLEWDYGDYEGITTKEIHKIDPNWTVFTKDPKNGETSYEVEVRADRLIKEALKQEGRVAFFSSGHFSRSLIARWLNFPVSHGRYFALSPASYSILSFEHDYQVIKSLNNLPY
ncbi:MAG: Acid phosphatase [Chlamydiia bacterium]|nr:Acid phosphatase [Chlamydiia bacterium]